MSTITTIAAGDQITNSRTVINTNFSNLNTDKIETTVLDTDTALTANSDAKIATQKAVKAYVDGVAAISSPTTGVSVGPALSSTQSITHSLGRVPKIIRITGYGIIAGSPSSVVGGQTTGAWTTISGNKCAYATAATQGAASTIGTSSAFAAYLSGLQTVTQEYHASGVVQNVTSTTFDIVWTNTGDVSTFCVFTWDAN